MNSGSDENPTRLKESKEEGEGLRGLGGPMTRSKAKKAQQTLTQLVYSLMDSIPNEPKEELKPVHCITHKEGPNEGHGLVEEPP